MRRIRRTGQHVIAQLVRYCNGDGKGGIQGVAVEEEPIFLAYEPISGDFAWKGGDSRK